VDESGCDTSGGFSLSSSVQTVNILPPWLSILIYHLGDKQQACWWPQFRDVVSLHRHERQKASLLKPDSGGKVRRLSRDVGSTHTAKVRFMAALSTKLTVGTKHSTSVFHYLCNCGLKRTSCILTTFQRLLSVIYRSHLRTTIELGDGRQ
jgi:hypothetical protein